MALESPPPLKPGDRRHGVLSSVYLGPDPPGSVEGERPLWNLHLSCHPHPIRQHFVVLSKSPHRDEESAFLSGFEVEFCDTLTSPSEAAEGGECRGRLTLSRILIQDSASLRSEREIKSRPASSATISAKAWTASALSVLLITYEGVLWTKIYLRTPFTTDHQ